MAGHFNITLVTIIFKFSPGLLGKSKIAICLIQNKAFPGDKYWIIRCMMDRGNMNGV